MHELRYLIAPAHEPEHGYLPLLAAVSVFALALAAGQLAGSMADARTTGRDDRSRPSFGAAWRLLALAIAAVFTVQELIEALIGGSGATAPLAVVQSGGWIAYPLSLGVAALLALALTGVRAAVRDAARAARAALRPRRPVARRLPAAAPRPNGSPLALNLAGRAPPLSG